MIILALGANLPGVWGTPKQALRRALDELKQAGIQIITTSKLYCTTPYGIDTQAFFFNAVAFVNCSLPAYALLKKCKQLESQAGRKATRRWQPRSLDIDIVDYNRVICNWKLKKPNLGRKLILPHARTHERAFVLAPIAEVAPFWHHPVLGLSACELLKRPHVRDAGAVLDDLGAF